MSEENPVKLLDNRLIDKVIEKYRSKPGAVLALLEEVQQLHEHKYLPQETLEYISRQMHITLSQLYSVVTFYSFFNLQPQGKHCIQVCRGTACHSKGSKHILDSLYTLLGIKKDMPGAEESAFITTSDNKFTVRVVACFGQCALTPVVVVDDVIYTNMTVEKLKKVIKNIP
jgi:NADH-quinone oxidoreductase subunit E